MIDKPNILIIGGTTKIVGSVVEQLVNNKDINLVAATRSPEQAQAFGNFEAITGRKPYI